MEKPPRLSAAALGLAIAGCAHTLPPPPPLQAPRMDVRERALYQIHATLEGPQPDGSEVSCATATTAEGADQKAQGAVEKTAAAIGRRIYYAVRGEANDSPTEHIVCVRAYSDPDQVKK